MFKKIFLMVLSLVLVACQGGENKPNIELIQDMMDGPQIEAQEGDDGEITMRVPPKGTVPRGYKPYPYDKFDYASADKLASPIKTLSLQELKSFEQVGKERYEIYCGICHGNSGKGDGSVAEKMIKTPPNLTEATYKNYSDGRIYNVITNGFGLMGSYAGQIPNETDRWAVVEYVRKLQSKE